MANRWGENRSSDRLYFLGLQNHCSHEIKSCLLLGRKVMTNLDSIFKTKDITLLTKVHLVKAMFVFFFSSQVWMWELDLKEVWVLKNWYFQTVVLEKTLEGCLDCKEIKPVHPKKNQPWLFLGRTDAEALVLWSHVVMSWLTGKDWFWERLRAGGEGSNRGWDGWVASSTQWSWVWANSWRCWRIGKPGVLQSMGSQSWTRLSDWTTTELIY